MPSRSRRSCAIARAVATSSLLLLAACASVGPAHERPSEPGLGGARAVEGRLSVRYKDLASGKEDALTGRFEWMQRGTARDDDVELTLLDPLGQTVALIRSDPDHASITFRDGRKVEGATPEALTQDTLGWTVPLRGLASWLDGRAASGSAAVSLDDGRLRQDNWTIRFVRDDETSKPRAQSGAQSIAQSTAQSTAQSKLPKRIDLFYPGPPAEIEMRLVIDRRSGA